MTDKADEIVQTYDEVNEVLKELDDLHAAIIQKHEADFVISYKDHMVRVQQDLAEFKKKSSEYYLNMKKNEKIRMLESSISFFRQECIKMATSIEMLKTRTKKLTTKLKFSEEEKESWHDEAKKIKFQNLLLRNTIE